MRDKQRELEKDMETVFKIFIDCKVPREKHDYADWILGLQEEYKRDYGDYYNINKYNVKNF